MTDAIGLDFGTTNTIGALANDPDGWEFIEFSNVQESGATFRGHRHFEATAQFVELYDCTAFDPAFGPAPLSPF